MSNKSRANRIRELEAELAERDATIVSLRSQVAWLRDQVTIDMFAFQQSANAITRDVFDGITKLADPFDADPNTLQPPGVATKRSITMELRARGLRGFRVEAHGGLIDLKPHPEGEPE